VGDAVTKESLLDDFRSRDEHRIESATLTIINTREAETLRFLAAMRDDIDAATHGLEFGEGFESTPKQLQLALEKLTFFASGAGCLCELYPRHQNFGSFDPEGERDKGHVSILKKDIPPVFDARYECACVHCDTRYTVQGPDYRGRWEWQSKKSLLADLLSRDSTRIYLARFPILVTRDEETLSFFAAHRDEIEAARDDVELDTASRERLGAVLEKLEFFVSRPGCWCTLYPRSDMQFSPESERVEGHVSILRKEQVWMGYRYVCQCAVCGTRYDVDESTDIPHSGCSWRTKDSLLADFLSRDEERIRMATRKVIEARDLELLQVLAERRGEIETATGDVEFGLMPWMRDYLAFALEKLSFVASRGGCLCQLYPKHSGFIPEEESIQGHVSVVRKVQSTAAGGQARYVCKCADCGAVYHADPREGYYTWWQWTAQAPRWRFWSTR